MKILAINGSGRSNGNTKRLLKECEYIMKDTDEFEVIDLSTYDFSGCIGCEGCAKTYKCVIQDDMQKLYPKIEEADGLVLASPTYFYNISSKMKAFIERLYPYEIFHKEDRHVWLSYTEVFGLKYGLVIGVCEQLKEEDMGFTIEAMSLPLQSLGYRVVDEVKVLNLFTRHEAEKDDESLEKVRGGMRKLYQTIELKQELLSAKRSAK
jgi:multimeric flavodoxin WrbA